MKKVLLVCYSFPPNVGVGGRRWAKFAKYLAQDDTLIHVVSNFNKDVSISEWTSDVNSENIINHSQNVFYPSVYISNPLSVVEKLKYRFWLFFFKIFSKGALYDRSFFWKKTILKNVKRIIKENDIKNIIVTGPPFRLMYFTSLIKNDLKDINLIIDFRDPWTDNSSFMGFDSLSKARLDFEKLLEKKTISSANYVISANEYLTNLFKNKYSNVNEKFTTIINGFDNEEFCSLNIKSKNSGYIKFIMAGTLYPNVEYLITPFLNYLSNLEVEDTDFSKKIIFDFYGQIDGNVKQMFYNSNKANLIIHGFKSISIVREKMFEADYCFMFIAPNHASNFNTKFYEYLSLKKPIILFSNSGEISEFILSNKLGFHIKPETFKKDFDELVFLIKENNFEFNYNFDISDFDIKHLALKVKKLLL